MMLSAHDTAFGEFVEHRNSGSDMRRAGDDILAAFLIAGRSASDAVSSSSQNTCNGSKRLSSSNPCCRSKRLRTSASRFTLVSDCFAPLLSTCYALAIVLLDLDLVR
jgi:hypothetical protein